MYFIKQMLITKVEKQRLNSKMKLLAQLQKYTLKKVQVMLDTLVEKLQYLLVVVLHMVQKEKLVIKKENLTKVKKN